jgi:hypothetical protein
VRARLVQQYPLTVPQLGVPLPVSSYPKHVPKHRAPATSKVPRAALRTTLTLSSMAVVATGFAVGGGYLSVSGQPTDPDTLTTSATGAAADSAPTRAGVRSQAGTAAGSTQREEVVSRSDRRDAADPLKETALSVGEDNAMARSEDLSDEDPRVIAQALLAEYGWSGDQFSCLDALWTRESNWRVSAANSSSGAYGIPQSLPGSKMATVAPDWRTNPITQIRWGLGYIEDRYGSPCGAWGHSQGHGWY